MRRHPGGPTFAGKLRAGGGAYQAYFGLSASPSARLRNAINAPNTSPSQGSPAGSGTALTFRTRLPTRSPSYPSGKLHTKSSVFIPALKPVVSVNGLRVGATP